MIIDQTCRLLTEKYRDHTEQLTISDVVIGIHLTAVRLSDNSIGTSSNITEDHSFCSKKNRDFGDFTPLKIIDRKVTDILRANRDSRIFSSLKTAVINAVSSGLLSSGNYTIIEDCDPVQLIDLNPGKTITIVGAFQSYIQKISGTGARLFVLELNENALSDDQKRFFVPADQFSGVFSQSDIVIITGQTLVNRSIDELLDAVPKGAQVIVTGPSAGIFPDILFGKKVNIIGTTRITNPDLLFEVVGQGGAAYHLFEYCARKICILNGAGQQVK